MKPVFFVRAPEQAMSSPTVLQMTVSAAGGQVGGLDKSMRDDLDAITAQKIGDLVIDEETGEVLEWPEGVSGDKISALILRAVQARRNREGWEQAEALYKRAIGDQLSRAGVKAAKTQWGTASWRAPQPSPVGRADRLEAIAELHELTGTDLLLIYSCGTHIDGKRLLLLAEKVPSLAKAITEMIEWRETKVHVRIDPPREAAPEIEVIGR